jgi:hypothetical protein
MDVSGSISNIGQYCASVAAMARAAWFVAQDGPAKILPTFVAWSYHDGVTLAPIASIAITSVVVFALTALPFEYVLSLCRTQRLMILCLQHHGANVLVCTSFLVWCFFHSIDAFTDPLPLKVFCVCLQHSLPCVSRSPMQCDRSLHRWVFCIFMGAPLFCSRV